MNQSFCEVFQEILTQTGSLYVILIRARDDMHHICLRLFTVRRYAHKLLKSIL
jgi:hypothetical protein